MGCVQCVRHAFYGTISFHQDVGSWDVSRAPSMSRRYKVQHILYTRYRTLGCVEVDVDEL
jgi:hypothetical protein